MIQGGSPRVEFVIEMKATMENSWMSGSVEDAHMVHVDANGLRFEVAEADRRSSRIVSARLPGVELQLAASMPLLAKMGYRVWAPNQRGYGGSTKPAGIDNYTRAKIVTDAAALFDASGASKLTLVGHDWGGAIAWLFAFDQVRPIERLVVMNMPHPYRFAAALRHWPQRWRSWYIGTIQVPWLPEWWLSRNDAAQIRQAFRGMAVDKSRFPGDVLDIYAAAAKKPGALTAMLNWYRAAVRHRGRIVIANGGRIAVPVLMIWGEEDSALGLETLDGTKRYVTNLTVSRLAGVSHWVQQEAPKAVNTILTDWLPDLPGALSFKQGILFVDRRNPS
jgi:epoxide hydrolase 4